MFEINIPLQVETVTASEQLRAASLEIEHARAVSAIWYVFLNPFFDNFSFATETICAHLELLKLTFCRFYIWNVSAELDRRITRVRSADYSFSNSTKVLMFFLDPQTTEPPLHWAFLITPWSFSQLTSCLRWALCSFVPHLLLSKPKPFALSIASAAYSEKADVKGDNNDVDVMYDEEADDE